MSRLLFTGMLSCLLWVGCTHNSPQSLARFHEDGRSKPIVSLVPVIDHSQATIPWSLSEELTCDILYRLNKKNNLFLVDQEAIKGIIKNLNDKHHPFQQDLNWMKKHFQGHEFVAFLEIIEHDFTTHETLKDSYTASKPVDLNMSMRIRVVDLRETPKVILQEIVHKSLHIPRKFADIDYKNLHWGTNSYAISPIGLAHSELAKEVSSRLEEYLLIAKVN